MPIYGVHMHVKIFLVEWKKAFLRIMPSCDAAPTFLVNHSIDVQKVVDMLSSADIESLEKVIQNSSAFAKRDRTFMRGTPPFLISVALVRMYSVNPSRAMSFAMRFANSD